MTSSRSRQLRINTPRIMAELVDDELILVDFDNGSYYSLRGVGCHIVEFLREWATPEEVVQAVLDRYRGEPEEVRESVVSFLTRLEEEHVLVSSVEISNIDRRNSLTSGLTPGGDKAPFESPVFDKYDDMQELLLLDPIHEVDDTGWPSSALDD